MHTIHRLLRQALLALIVLASNGVLAQAADHDVRMRIPEIIGIRLLGGGSGIRTVTFDYAAAPEAYLSALESGGSLPPTEVVRFDGIEVNASRNGRWYVEVVASPLAFTGGASAAGLALEDLRVDRGAVSGPRTRRHPRSRQVGLVPDFLDALEYCTADRVSYGCHGRLAQPGVRRFGLRSHRRRG